MNINKDKSNYAKLKKLLKAVKGEAPSKTDYTTIDEQTPIYYHVERPSSYVINYFIAFMYSLCIPNNCYKLFVPKQVEDRLGYIVTCKDASLVCNKCLCDCGKEKKHERRNISAYVTTVLIDANYSHSSFIFIRTTDEQFPTSTICSKHSTSPLAFAFNMILYVLPNPDPYRLAQQKTYRMPILKCASFEDSDTQSSDICHKSSLSSTGGIQILKIRYNTGISGQASSSNGIDLTLNMSFSLAPFSSIVLDLNTCYNLHGVQFPFVMRSRFARLGVCASTDSVPNENFTRVRLTNSSNSVVHLGNCFMQLVLGAQSYLLEIEQLVELFEVNPFESNLVFLGSEEDKNEPESSCLYMLNNNVGAVFIALERKSKTEK